VVGDNCFSGNLGLLPNTYLCGMKEWHLGQIPKILYLYWGGGKMCYLRYLTISTFRYYNPDWNIVLCRPEINQKNISWETPEQKYPSNYVDYSENVKNDGVIIRDFNFGHLGFSNVASSVHQSDFIRWRLLSTTGGLWADMDILFTKPMNELYFNTENNKEINTVFCISHYGHSIGFLMSSQNNKYFERIAGSSLMAYQKKEYQCMGSLLCNKLFPTVKSADINGVVAHNLAMDVVYAYDTYHAREIFSPPKLSSRFTDKTIGIHWYAGGKFAGAYLNRTGGGAFPDKNLIGKLTKEYENINDNGISQQTKIIRHHSTAYKEIISKGVQNYYNRQRR